MGRCVCPRKKLELYLKGPVINDQWCWYWGLLESLKQAVCWSGLNSERNVLERVYKKDLKRLILTRQDRQEVLEEAGDR